VGDIRPTLTEVALRAGVSPATASRVINDATREMVHPETRQRVDAAVADLGYVRRRAAPRRHLPPGAGAAPPVGFVALDRAQLADSLRRARIVTTAAEARMVAGRANRAAADNGVHGRWAAFAIVPVVPDVR
jgi:hypothetical protein